eukprot:TRINITY_DN44849_c0_g2_i1.p1 TRINITY_DN44849_c0_g2~~TRINITY_DN44849_c0_g2_i1.p1  ORF type:complete len:304 (-),score=19.04 TRINITY_DN44849_c0_g2_i1:632-1543(-)
MLHRILKHSCSTTTGRYVTAATNAIPQEEGLITDLTNTLITPQIVDRVDSVLLPTYKKPIQKRPNPAPILEVLEQVKERAEKRQIQDETVDIAVILGTEPRRSDHLVRGSMSLPHGTAKKVKVCVFATGDKLEAAKVAGADVIGDAQLLQLILDTQGECINFQKIVATPDQMSLLTRVARILGPRQLMPSPKLGTLTQDVAGMVKEFKKGRLEFRVDRDAVVQVPIAKVSWPIQHISENFVTFFDTLLNVRPVSLPGKGMGGYVNKVVVTSTRGVGHRVVLPTILELIRTIKPRLDLAELKEQ